MKAILALEDGTVYHGDGFGAEGTACGEVCFNTSMTGYQEIVTDPSYKAQIVAMTYPHIGNYGVNLQDIESYQPHVAGFVVRELSSVVSNWRADDTLGGYLQKNGIPGIEGVDTRALTKKLRVRGAMNGLISTEGLEEKDAVAKARAWHGLAGVDYVKEVTHSEAFDWDTEDRVSANWNLVRGHEESDPRQVRDALPEADIPLVAYDFGVKYNILRRLRQRGFRVHVVPATSSAEEVRALKPQGVFLSNGPGDPSALPYAIRAVGDLAKSGIPMFGICLGHQVLAQALGGKTFKLKFGHRGANQPVKDLNSGRVEITAQNHGFAVDPESLPSEVEVDRINLNDQTVEGLRHRSLPVFSVQYHPEASPGPHDSTVLFDEFRTLIEKR
jgi:carbamoyl-phosphate synthase small subunit